MVSSLGHDARHACAAARAGLSRRTESDYVVLAGDDGQPGGLNAHCVPELTTGFEGLPRLVQLATGAVRDLASRKSDLTSTDDSLAVYLSVCDLRRQYSDLELVADEAIRKSMQEAAESDEGGIEDETILRRFGHAIAAGAGLRQPPPIRFVGKAGHTGFAEASAAAMTDLVGGAVKHALVLAVDSLVEESTISWLDATGRLTTPSFAVGLEPGEAAVGVLLEDASAVGSQPVTRLDRVKLGEESGERATGELPSGKVLAELLLEAASDPVSSPWIIIDHNGEYARAMEWGGTLNHLRKRGLPIETSTASMPAISFGDTGAASGGVALCFALNAFERGYHHSSEALIASCSFGPQRSVFRVSRAA